MPRSSRSASRPVRTSRQFVSAKTYPLPYPMSSIGLGAALLAHVGPDEALEPVERVENDRAILVRLCVEFAERAEDVAVLSG